MFSAEEALNGNSMTGLAFAGLPESGAWQLVLEAGMCRWAASHHVMWHAARRRCPAVCALLQPGHALIPATLLLCHPAEKRRVLSQPGGLCFSRAEPRHKQDIVRLLKDMGEVRRGSRG